MSSTILSSLTSKTLTQSLSPRNYFPQIRTNTHSFTLNSFSPTTKTLPQIKLQSTQHQFLGPLKKTVGFPLKFSGFAVKEQNEAGSSDEGESNQEVDFRGESSMPERFRYLTKEAPDKPVRWPLLIVLAFAIYAWRTVLLELSIWTRPIGAIVGFFRYVLEILLIIAFHYIGDPLIRGAMTLFYSISSFYSSIVSYAPVPELTTIIVLTSTILAVAEATVPDSVNSQPYLLTVAGLVGFAAVKNYISEPFFWTLLVGLFVFAKFVRKRDYVTSALPVAAVLAAVGEPWVRFIVMGSYLGLAILHHSKNPTDENQERGAINKIPVPLVCAALAIGIRVAAKWAGYRHLTWMVV